MNPSFQWQVWFLRPNYHWVPWPGGCEGFGLWGEKGGGAAEFAVSRGRRWRHGPGPKRDEYPPGLYCIRGQRDLWQTHATLICAQPDNASQGQNTSAQCFLTGCFFNYMSEAIKLRRRFPHKAPFYVPAITANYKQQEKILLEGKLQREEKKWVYFHTHSFFFPPGWYTDHRSTWLLIPQSDAAREEIVHSWRACVKTPGLHSSHRRKENTNLYKYWINE